MISQIHSPRAVQARLIAACPAAVVLSDLNELNRLNKLYKSTELSNKSTESDVRETKDKHQRTSIEFSFVEQQVDIKNSAILGSNESSHQSCTNSSSTSSANDKNENKSDASHIDQDPGRCMINELNGEIKSHRIMSPEFTSRDAYKCWAGSSSDCLPTKSTSRSAYLSTTSSICRPPADHSLSDYRLNDNISSNCSSLMDLLANQPVVNQKMKFSAFNYAALLSVCLLICGPTSATAGKSFDCYLVNGALIFH